MSATRGRLASYAPWQLRDYVLTTAGMAALLIPFVLGVFPLILGKLVATKSGASEADVQRLATSGFSQFVFVLALAGPMFTIAGIVSGDRMLGISRFVFSKPVNPSAYYLQAWLVRGAALLAIATVLAQSVNLFIARVPWMVAVEVTAVAWVLIGGFGFLLSVLFARDVAIVLVFYLIVVILDQVRTNVPAAHWVKPVLTVLPPFNLITPVRDALLRGTPLPMGDLWHALIFGTVCVALATYLVRRLPLVR